MLVRQICIVSNFCVCVAIKKNNNNKINIPPSRVKFTWFSTDLVTDANEENDK